MDALNPSIEGQNEFLNPNETFEEYIEDNAPAR